jgi:hypothetical protein
MSYSNAFELIIMPEYGRIVQELVQRAKEIEEAGKRQAFVESIIEIILKLNPSVRSIDDYMSKLWKHIFHIANYELDVVMPAGISIPTRPELTAKGQRIAYPANNNRMRHYGVHIQKLIKKAMATEEGPIREGMIQTIGSFMKLAYRQWNKEHLINEDTIKDDLLIMSSGELLYEEQPFDINDIPQALRRRPQSQNNGPAMPGMAISPHQHPQRRALVNNGKERILRHRKTRK